MATLEDVIIRGNRTSQPLATDVATGSIYYVTDEGKIEQSDGAAWQVYSGTPAGSVTYTMIQSVTEAVLLGRGDGSGAGDVEEITIGANLTLTGTTLAAAAGGDTFIIPTADESINNNTLQDDDELFFSVDANSIYIIEGLLFFSTGALSTVDAQCEFTFPAAATVSFLAEALALNQVSSQTAYLEYNRFELASGAVTNWGVGVVANLPCATKFRAILRTGANSGTFRLQWAQNITTGGTPAIREKDSYFRYKKVA